MTAPRIQHDARTLPSEKLAEAVEEELDRLRRARPHLEARIDRAATVLVVQLSSPPKARPIRCRVAANGRRVALVESRTTPGTVYEVDPSDWSCSCPDHRRRGAVCLHGLSVWVLDRVSRSAESHEDGHQGTPHGCEGCGGGGWIHAPEQFVDKETGEVTTAFNTVRCRVCAATKPHHLTDEEMRAWMASVPWTFAKTMPEHPHEYTLKRRQDPARFDAAARTIWECGYDRSYLRRAWRSLNVGDHYVWVWTRPEGPRHPYPTDTILVNRAERHQGRIA